MNKACAGKMDLLLGARLLLVQSPALTHVWQHKTTLSLSYPTPSSDLLKHLRSHVHTHSYTYIDLKSLAGLGEHMLLALALGRRGLEDL